MKVFVTGASGFIGLAVTKELLAAGHSVVGLARSEASAKAIEAAGAEVHHGSLEDLKGLKEAAAASDGVIHLAFNHDFVNVPRDVAAKGDRDAISAMAEALAGTGKPLIVTTATGVTAVDVVGTEKDKYDPAGTAAARGLTEDLALELVPRGIRTTVVRLPPTVHGAGDPNFMTGLIHIARQKGVSGYVKEGLNLWPAVYKEDAAKLYLLALESAPAGSILHAVAEEGVPTKDIAEVIGKKLGLPVKSVKEEETMAHFGWLGVYFSKNMPSSSKATKELLKWAPEGPGLLDDMEKNYF